MKTCRVFQYVSALMFFCLVSFSTSSRAESSLVLDFLDEMVPIIDSEIDKGLWFDPMPKGQVFNTCVDWHSAVECFWAPLRIHRFTGKHASLAQKVEKLMTPSGIKAELDKLRDYPKYEMPYGRAAAVLLAIEFEKWAIENNVADPQRLRAFGTFAANSILKHYKQNAVNPALPEYQNPSWALYHIYSFYDFVGDRGKQSDVDSIIETQLLRKSFPNVNFGNENGFFSRYGNLVYLIGKTQSEGQYAQFLNDNPVHPGDLAPPTSNFYRIAGQNASRAWGLRILTDRAKTEEEKALYWNAVIDHFWRAVEYWQIHKNNWLWTHWVPQFNTYAITELWWIL